jgi:GTP-binding protein LepA
VDRVGIFTPKMTEPARCWQAGEVGFVIAGIKEIDGAPVGDTMTHRRARRTALPGFKRSSRGLCRPVPRASDDYEAFRDALRSSPERLGAALRAGDLRRARLRLPLRLSSGMLHMEIVQERLEREYESGPDHHRADRGLRGADHRRRDVLRGQSLQAAAGQPDREIREPIITANILVPQDYVGASSRCAWTSAACRSACSTSASRWR